MSSAVSGDSDRPGAAVDGGAVGALLALEVGEVGNERAVGLAGDVALEAADDLELGFAFGGAAKVNAAATATSAAINTATLLTEAESTSSGHGRLRSRRRCGAGWSLGRSGCRHS
jgi:hypothetical protein